MSGNPGLSVVILAAGEGTRMKSTKPKVLFPLCGRPMIEYVLDAAMALKPDSIVVVVGHRGEQVIEAINQGWRQDDQGSHNILRFAWQREQRGTAHAVNCARDAVDPGNDVLVLCGDTPLVSPAMLQRFVQEHVREKADISIVTTEVDDPGSYGRIVRDHRGKVVRIVEASDASPETAGIREVNAGIYLARAATLFCLISDVRDENSKREFYLTDIIGLAVCRGLSVNAYCCKDEMLVHGINDRFALAQAEAYLRGRILRELMLSGVTVRDPESVYIDYGVRVGPDTVIEPFTFLRGKTVIGQGCVIGPGADITDSRIGDGSRIWFSVVEASEVGEHVQIGPFSHLRPGTTLAPDVLIGNFAELKNTSVGSGSKVHHHCYLGDSVIGERVNIGAGAVTVNYDGIRKHRTLIHDEAFIGCNANLIAPVAIGKGAYVAAGSTITSDVPDGALAIARERQTNKDGWVARRKEQQFNQGR